MNKITSPYQEAGVSAHDMSKVDELRKQLNSALVGKKDVVLPIYCPAILLVSISSTRKISRFSFAKDPFSLTFF